jgi:ATP-dependent DNA ligase
MLVKCRGVEAKYLVRGLLKGKLRIGVAKMTVLVSLAHAVVTQPPAAVTAAVKVWTMHCYYSLKSCAYYPQYYYTSSVF